MEKSCFVSSSGHQFGLEKSTEMVYCRNIKMKQIGFIKGSLQVVFFGSMAAYVFVSIFLLELSGPYHFGLVNRESQSVLPFLKAAVASGDMTLIKSSFPVLINEMFERVFETYVYESNLAEKISRLGERVSESRDLEIAKGHLAIRENDFDKAREYFDRAQIIDPSAFVPQLPSEVQVY